MAARPRQAKFTLASLKWVLANRAYTPWYLVRYWRLLRFKLGLPAHHHPRHGASRQGWRSTRHRELAHPGDRPLGTSGQEHDPRPGSLRSGDAVLGRDNVINTYLDIEIGDSVLMADWCYICDFDHRWMTSRCRSKTRHHQESGADRARHLIGVKVERAAGGTKFIGRGCVLGLARGGPRRNSRLSDRGRGAGQGGQEPPAILGGTAAQLSQPPPWPTSNARKVASHPEAP